MRWNEWEEVREAKIEGSFDKMMTEGFTIAFPFPDDAPQGTCYTRIKDIKLYTHDGIGIAGRLPAVRSSIEDIEAALQNVEEKHNKDMKATFILIGVAAFFALIASAF